MLAFKLFLPNQSRILRREGEKKRESVRERELIFYFFETENVSSE